jgi:hypothetical protein
MVLPALVLGELLVSCGKPLASKPSSPRPPDVTAKIPVESYFPLTDQSRWTYRIQDFVKKISYLSKVRVHGRQFVDSVKRDGIGVEERYSSFGPGGPYILEEQEPILYFHENGYLNRILLTYQAGKVVAASGSSDTQFLPEYKRGRLDSTAGPSASAISAWASFRHTVALERETVTVSAGTFTDCVRSTLANGGLNSGYRPERISSYYADWYAPGVGLLTRHGTTPHERERTRIELTEYWCCRHAARPVAGGQGSTPARRSA